MKLPAEEFFAVSSFR